ncbi:MAG: LysE family transporter [Alphaproteobacteria bacterium]|nr:LysE family transporter [Alphaproteobacteria bacterium]
MLEEVGVFYRGVVLGLVIAAPVGPVGLLCIRRTLQKGVLTGFATGIGAAIADTIFAWVAVMGISAILEFIHHYHASIRLIGGGIVLFTAWHTWHDRPKPPQPIEIIEKVLNIAQEKLVWKTLRACISGLIITLTNPLTLFGTLAVVATFGDITEKLEADLLVAGIFAGSVAWWFLLSAGVGLFRCHFTESRIVSLNRATAVMLAALAGWAIISGIRAYIA